MYKQLHWKENCQYGKDQNWIKDPKFNVVYRAVKGKQQIMRFQMLQLISQH